jgi:hypothetical protein
VLDDLTIGHWGCRLVPCLDQIERDVIAWSSPGIVIHADEARRAIHQHIGLFAQLGRQRI